MKSSIYDTMDLSWLLMGRYCRLYREAKMGLGIWVYYVTVMLQMEGESGGSGSNDKGGGRRKGKINQNEVLRFTPSYSH